jgi:hypothetical protein
MNCIRMACIALIALVWYALHWYHVHCMEIIWYCMVCISISNSNAYHTISIAIKNANAYHTIPYHCQCIPYKAMTRKCIPFIFPFPFPLPMNTIPHHTIVNSYHTMHTMVCIALSLYGMHWKWYGMVWYAMV